MEKLTNVEKQIFQKVEEALKDEELICNPNLSLNDFAKAIETPVRALSDTINKFYKKGFRALVNPYRVHKAAKIIESGQTKDLIGIGRSVGFNSRTTFFNAFKQELGISPREFAKLVKGDLR